MPKTDLNRAVSLCILPLFCAFLQEKRGYPTPENAILHPILHRKSPIITGILGYGWRKCRIFFQNFFRGGERRDIGPGVKEGDLPSWFIEHPLKTSDFFGQKYGCFASKVRMFASKKSDVFDFRKGESIEYGLIWFSRFYPAGDIYAIGHARPEDCLYQFKSVKSGFNFSPEDMISRIRIYLI